MSSGLNNPFSLKMSGGSFFFPETGLVYAAVFAAIVVSAIQWYSNMRKGEKYSNTHLYTPKKSVTISSGIAQSIIECTTYNNFPFTTPPKIQSVM